MTTSILINALGQALFESCGQALIIYIALQLFFQLFPGIGAKYRYDINYLGLTIICCWFLANLAKIYLHNASLPHYSALLYNGNVLMEHGGRQVPTLLQRAEAFIGTYAKYITGLYLIGLMLHAFRLLGGLVHIHHIRKQKNLVQDGLWSQKVILLVKKLGVVKKVSLYFSEHIQIPLTIGHLKPIIIFPLALINNLDNDQVEAILLHELAHIKRHDYLLNILQCIMETILCFNPFVWLISKTIRTEREYCCDDIVVDEDCNNFSYAKALFIIAQQNSQAYPLAMASTGSKKYPLLNRIKRLNTMKTKDSLPKFHLLILIAVATIGVLLAWGIPQYSSAKARHHNKLTVKVSPTVNKPIINAPLPAKITIVAVAPKKKTNIAYTDTATNGVLKDTSANAVKSKFKIVVDDGKGNQREYNSIGDLPDSTRDEFLKENPSFGAYRFKFKDSMRFADMERFKMNPEWKKQMAEMRFQGDEMRKKFNSPEWKKQMADMRKQGEEMRKKYNSPEWKKQMDDMRKQGDEMRKKYNSPEWKKQMDDMRKQGEEMRKKYNSPEWKKQMDDIRKQSDEIRKKFDNPEFRKQQEDMKRQIIDEANSPELRKMQAEIKDHILDEVNSPEYKKFHQDMIDQIHMQYKSPDWEKMQAEIEKDNKKIMEQINSPDWQKHVDDMQKALQDDILKKTEKEVQDTIKN